MKHARFVVFSVLVLCAALLASPAGSAAGEGDVRFAFEPAGQIYAAGDEIAVTMTVTMAMISTVKATAAMSATVTETTTVTMKTTAVMTMTAVMKKRIAATMTAAERGSAQSKRAARKSALPEGRRAAIAAEEQGEIPSASCIRSSRMLCSGWHCSVRSALSCAI